MLFFKQSKDANGTIILHSTGHGHKEKVQENNNNKHQKKRALQTQKS